MKIDYGFLKDQYSQSNEHLRETDRKRDVLFGFYITLTVAYYGFFEKIVQDQLISIYLIVGLTLFGACLGILFTLFRGWHGIYVLICIIIQQIMHQKESTINKEFVKNIDFKFNLFTSVELFIYFILSVIIFLNALYGYKILKSESKTFFALSLIFIAIVQFICHFIGMWWLNHLKNKGYLSTKYLWMLQNTCTELDTKIKV